MNILSSWLRRVYTRNVAGQHEYFIDKHGNWSTETSNLIISQSHPILTPALLFVSQLFSSARFELKRKSTDNIVRNHWSLELLENPNSYQTQADFLEAALFNQIAEGKVVIWMKKLPGFSDPQELHILTQDKILWPEEILDDPFYDFENTKATIKYMVKGREKLIKLSELLIIYDLPNAMENNRVEVKSRLDGLKQTLVNTYDSLIAKNIILKTNGKELVTGEKGQTQMSPEEKKNAESMFNGAYGLAKKRLRALIVKGKINWKSLHIALRDLGLDESVKVDGNLIYTGLHIPKDILSLEAKKTTYNNFKESMVSYIQNDIQSKADSFAQSYMKALGLTDNLKMEADFDHLPVMQFVRIERYKSIKAQGEALDTLLTVGVPEEIALEMCDFDKTMKLNPRTNAKKSNKNKKSSFKKIIKNQKKAG